MEGRRGRTVGEGGREGEGGRRGKGVGVQYKGGLLPYLVIKTSSCGWWAHCLRPGIHSH